jgi:hypothetical protein
MMINRRRQAIRGLHAAVVVAVLIVCVLTAHALLDFSASWMVGAAIAYPVATIVERRLLPRVEPLTDEERLHLVPLPVWLIVTISSIVIFHYGTSRSWISSVAFVAVWMSILLAVELRQRSHARHRLAAARNAE